MEKAAYLSIRGIAGLLMHTFFSQIEIEGEENIPKDGPVIFTSMHPNALVDPALVLVHCHRHVRIISKEQLFHLPVMKNILKGLKAVPVRRAVDLPKGEENSANATHLNNTSMFSEVWKALDEGDAIAIFPEGTTEMVSHMRKIKTGAARIALGFGKEHRTGSNKDKQDLRIVPVGLNYTERNRFRSKVLITFGRPIILDENWIEKYEKDQWPTVQELTNLLQDSLESLTTTAPDWATLKVIITAKNIIKPEYEQDIKYDIELTRRFLIGYQKVLSVLKKNPDSKDSSELEKSRSELENLRSELEDYQYTLDALGLSDHQVQIDKFVFATRKRPFLDLFFNDFILWPLAIAGLIFNLPIPVATKILGSRIARGEIVEEATYKLVAAMASIIITYGIFGGILTYYYGFLTGLVVVVLLMISGVVAVRLRPFATSVNTIKSWYTVVPDDLRKKREVLREKIKLMISKYSEFDVAKQSPQ